MCLEHGGSCIKIGSASLTKYFKKKPTKKNGVNKIQNYLQALRTGCPDYLDYYCNELGSLSMFFFCTVTKTHENQQAVKRILINVNSLNYFFSFQCQPEILWISITKPTFYLHFIFGQFLVLYFADRTENCSSIRLLMNSNISTALQLFAGVHTATGGQDSSFKSMACTFSCELRWSC